MLAEWFCSLSCLSAPDRLCSESSDRRGEVVGLISCVPLPVTCHLVHIYTQTQEDHSLC